MHMQSNNDEKKKKIDFLTHLQEKLPLKMTWATVIADPSEITCISIKRRVFFSYIFNTFSFNILHMWGETKNKKNDTRIKIKSSRL